MRVHANIIHGRTLYFPFNTTYYENVELNRSRTQYQEVEVEVEVEMENIALG